LFLQHQITRSWLDGDTLGAKVSAQEITIAMLDLDTETWEDSAITWSPDDEEVEVSLLLTEKQDDNQIEKSDLVKAVDIAFVASGEYTPFEIQISLVGQISASSSKRYLLTGDGVNALKLSEN